VLKQRILTALVLMPLVILAVLWLPHRWFAVVLTAILLVGAWEWAHIAGIVSKAWRINYVIGAGLLLTALTWLLHAKIIWLQTLLWVIFIGWSIALISVIRINTLPNLLDTSASNKAVSIISAICGYLILAGTFIGIIGIRQYYAHGPQLLLALMILIWVADSAAYFTGRALGKHKLAVHISPGKSWEGVGGAVLATALTAYLVGNIFNQSMSEQVRFQLVCLVSVGFSILGDLTESLFKRLAGVKDSGRILPGHGGVMDRIDSMTAAAPVFLLGLFVAGLP
jgi:phosphatidate cytidylyltransferase